MGASENVPETISLDNVIELFSTLISWEFYPRRHQSTKLTEPILQGIADH